MFIQTTEKPTESPKGIQSWFKSIFNGNFLSQPSAAPVEERANLYPAATVKRSILPEPPTCGGEFIDNRIYGGSDANVYEFPWMAFLEYSKTGKTLLLLELLLKCRVHKIQI